MPPIKYHPIIRQIRRNWSIICFIISVIIVAVLGIVTYRETMKQITKPMPFASPEDVLWIVVNIDFKPVILFILFILFIFGIYTAICGLEYHKVMKILKDRYTQEYTIRDSIFKTKREYENMRSSIMRRETELVKMKQHLIQ